MSDQVDSTGTPLDSDELGDPSDNVNSPDPLLGESPRSGALSSIGTRGDQQGRVDQARQSMGALQAQYVQHSNMAASGYQQQKDALDAATQRLLNMPTGPGAQEAAYRVAAAAGTGDSAGRFNPAGISAAHAGILQEQREAEMAKQQLLTQYGMQAPQMQIAAAGQLQNRDIQQMRIEQGNINNASTQADKVVNAAPKALPGGMIFNAATGQYENHPEIAQAQNEQKATQARNAAAIRAATLSAAAGNMDPATMDLLSEQFLKTGQMPGGLSRGGPQVPLAIAKMAAQKAAQRNDSMGAAVANQAIYKSNAASLTNLTKQFGAFQGFQNTMDNVGNQAKALSAGIDRTNIPILNQIFQSGQRKFTGNSPLAVFDTANNTFVSEYAKLMSGGMGNQAVTDAKSSEAHSRLNTAMQNGTYGAVVDQMRQEGILKNKGLTDNINSVKQQMGLLPPTPAAPTTPAPPVVRPGQAPHPLVSKWLTPPTAPAP